MALMHCWLPRAAVVGLSLVVGLPLGALAAEPPLREVIDREIRAGWQRKEITPAPAASDAEFLRRIYLDLVGVIPTAEETQAFLSDDAPDKRAKLIDRLLEHPRFGQHLGEVWDLLLFTRKPPGYDTDKRQGIQRWLARSFNENLPYDQLVRAILRAEGNSVDDGPPMFLVQYRNRPEDAIESITQLFLGVQLQCARCHDHPYEPWSQLDFYGMAAFLARLDVVKVGTADNLPKLMIGEKSIGDVLFTGPAKDARPGEKGEPVKPKFLHGDEVIEPTLPDDFKQEKFADNQPPPPPQFSRKNQLADWVVSADNPHFARASANRFWSLYFGRGIVHPVDHFSDINDPSHPELLDAVARAFADQGYNVKWLVRELCNSEAYQLASSGDVADAFPAWFQRARVRPLSAEELVDSWRVASGFDAAEQAEGKERSKERFHPLSSGYALQYFGQPTNGVGDFQGGLHEHLYMNNGQLGQLITTNKGGLVDELTRDDLPADAQAERLFLAVLSRPASDVERARLAAYLDEETDKNKRRERLRDAIWALMTCSEFRFNH